MDKILFALGGDDAEMVVIKALLSQAGFVFIQPQRGWGNHKFSPSDLGLEIIATHSEQRSMEGRSYEQPVPAAVKGVRQVVFVECRPAEGWPEGTSTVVIDHHGERAGEPASITQVLVRLRMMPGAIRAAAARTNINKERAAEVEAAKIEEVLVFSSETRRWVELVAANDAGYIPAMLALGATHEEIERVRALDRSAQGITPTHEVEALRALGEKEVFGRLTVVRMAHSKCATVSDRLFGAADQLLVLSGDGEVNFFGDGALCSSLKEKFGGWNGGSGLGTAGANAFWGGNPSQDEVLTFVRQQLS